MCVKCDTNNEINIIIEHIIYYLKRIAKFVYLYDIKHSYKLQTE